VELTNEFRVGVPVERAYAVLTDVELIAPCLPGAQLQEIEGDEYRGVVKVKVGPITATYKGAATFESRTEPSQVVLKASGKEMRGQGGASATITADLVPDGDGTKVTVTTDLTVTGKVAQFGRGVLADVSAKLLGQFVECLEGKLDDAPSGAPAPAVEAEAAAGPGDSPVAAPEEPADGEATEPVPAAAPTVRTIDAPEPQPVDLVSTAGSPVIKRLAVPAGILAVLWLVRLFLRRSK
jgi:carbon monoxide dehydrogenase subunit G